MDLKKWKFIPMILLLFMTKNIFAQLQLVKQHKTQYKIVLPQLAKSSEIQAAEVLKKYLKEISGADMEIVSDKISPATLEISIGKTNRQKQDLKLSNDAFVIRTAGKKLFIYGDTEKATLYGVYHFLDEYLGCRKYSADFSAVPEHADILVAPLNDIQQPQFVFRQVYYPEQYNQEYQDWHQLQHLEDDWGLWGHSFEKLVPASQYFKSHPEYYALVNGERKDTQLCLSNPDVYRILTENLARRIAESPEKKYWSVSQNDGLGYCTCPACSATDHKYGGPQGSLIHFVNKVAEKFPDQTISTLAYLYSKHPPQNLKPRKNVSIMLSTIDLDRAKAIETDPRSKGFRADLQGWKEISDRVMIWDYVVQFTNYLSPFPNTNVLQKNMNYFTRMGVSGIFSQGTENTFGEFSVLKSYLLAKLSWKPHLKTNLIFDEFMNAYYGKAAPFLIQYQQQLDAALQQSGKLLDIYGAPTSAWNSWLSPAKIEAYSALLDKAETAVKNEKMQLARVLRERLPLEFAVLQQARFYGIEKHGVFAANGKQWQIRPGFKAKVTRFIAAAKEANVKQLNEEGLTLVQYEEEWNRIFKEGPLLHLATGRSLTTLTDYNPDYPAKGNKTLTDGAKGYNDFQYNYLGWLGNDMEVVIDLASIQNVRKVSIGFLEDQRHWSFLPVKVIALVSNDNIHFEQVSGITLPVPYENYEKETQRITLSFDTLKKTRYIKIKAENQKSLPSWRNLPNRKPWIFCDEIEVYD